MAALTEAEAETARSFNRRDADVEAIRRDISTIDNEMAGVDARMAAMRGETNLLTWMTGTVIAPLVTALFRVFAHRAPGRAVGRPRAPLSPAGPAASTTARPA